MVGLLEKIPLRLGDFFVLEVYSFATHLTAKRSHLL